MIQPGKSAFEAERSLKSESGRPGSNRRRSAWKADALPTELLPQSQYLPWWRVMDSNHRRHSRQIYSLLPLATRATLRNCARFGGSGRSLVVSYLGADEGT